MSMKRVTSLELSKWHSMISRHVLPMCLLIMECHFDAMLCSKLGNKNSEVGRTECSWGPQVPLLWCRYCCGDILYLRATKLCRIFLVQNMTFNLFHFFAGFLPQCS